MRRSHKYNARRTEVDGIVFDSRREARRYRELRILVHAKQITGLELQPRFDLLAHTPAGPVPVGRYVADFAYVDARTGERRVEDAKGVRTSTYRLKRKLVEATHGITIHEV